MRVAVLLLLPGLALAGPAARQKAQSRRAEAQELVDDLLRGQANVNVFSNRIRYLGEETYACAELADIARKDADPEHMRVVSNVLASLGHPCAEPALITLLGNGDGATRMVAVQGLGRLKSRAAGPALVPLLQDKSMGVRREAARALGATHVASYGAALMKAATVEGEPEARVAMLAAVGGTGDQRQVAALEAFLTHSSESSRFAAAQGLCLLGARKGLDFARERLASKDRFERLEGLKLFEGVRARQPVALLTPLLDDQDHAVAALAARLLYQAGDPGKLDWLVLRSFQAQGDDKLVYEKELEVLMLPDDQRRAILAKAGIR